MQAHHVLITGSSGGGKTTYAREMHATYNGASIYVTSKDTESNVTGRKAGSRQTLNTAVRDASRASDVRVKWFGATYDKDLRTIRDWAHDIHTHLGWSTQIIVDEAQNSGLRDNTGPVKHGLHEDRDKRIKWVPVTQDPQDMKKGYSALKQCRYIVWVGEPNSFHKGFLSYYNLQDVQLPTKPYQFVVVKPSLPPTVAHSGTTSKQYS